MSSVSNGLYFLTLPLVSVMRAIYRKIRHARYLYIKRDVEKVWGARYTLGVRYLSRNTVCNATFHCTTSPVTKETRLFTFFAKGLLPVFLGSRPDHRYRRWLERQNMFRLINCKIIRLGAKCILVHGVEVKVSQWEVRTSRLEDLRSKAILLVLWPYCLEENFGYLC